MDQVACGQVHRVILRLLPIAILSVPTSDAARGMRDQVRAALRSATAATSLGGTIPELDGYLSPGAPTPPDATTERPEPRSPRAQSAGFRIGTFIGASIVMIIGGMPRAFDGRAGGNGSIGRRRSACRLLPSRRRAVRRGMAAAALTRLADRSGLEATLIGIGTTAAVIRFFHWLIR